MTQSASERLLGGQEKKEEAASARLLSGETSFEGETPGEAFDRFNNIQQNPPSAEVVESQSAPTLESELSAVADQARAGLAEFLGLPVDAVTAGIRFLERLGPGRGELLSEDVVPVGGSESLGAQDARDPQTTPGRFAGSAARVVGQNIVPAAGLVSSGPALARSTIPLARETGRAITRSPVGFTAAENVAAASAGIGGEAARTVAPDSPVAEFTGELLGAVTPGGFAATGRRIIENRSAARVGARRDEIADIAPAVEEARQASEATGIRLSQPQQTNVPAQQKLQSIVSELPAGARESVAFLKAQNADVSRAVDDILESIAPATAVETGPERFRTAAQQAVEAAKTVRRERTSPIYTEAFDNANPVDLEPVRQIIKGQLDDAAPTGEVPRSLKRVSNFISGENVSLKRLHNAKLEIDQMLAKTGDNSLGNTTKRTLIDIKKALVNQIEESNPLYRQAREAFEAESPAVTQLENSIVGQVSKLKDTQLKDVSARIFNQRNNKTVVQNARKVIQAVDPEAWNQIVRTEFENRLGSMRAIPDEGSVENIPGQMLTAIFGNKKKTDVLIAGLSPEQKKTMRYLQTALRRARTGRPGGSDTAAKTAALKKLEDSVATVLERALRPKERLASINKEAAFNKGVRDISRALFDTSFRKDVAKIRKLDPGTPQAARALEQLLRSASEDGNE